MRGAGVICQKKKSVHLVAVWCLRSFSTLCISVSNWTWNCLSSSFLFFQKGAVSLFHFPILETKRIRTIAEDETNVPWKESHRTIDDDKKNRSSDWQQMCVMVLKPGISGAFLRTKKLKWDERARLLIIQAAENEHMEILIKRFYDKRKSSQKSTQRIRNHHSAHGNLSNI